MTDPLVGADDPADLGPSRTLSPATIAGILVISIIVGAVVFVVGSATSQTEVVTGVSISLGRADASNNFNSQKVDDVRALIRSRPVLTAVSEDTGVSRARLRAGLALGNVRDGRVLDINYTAARSADREAVVAATARALGDTLGVIETNELSTSAQVLDARLADTVAEITALGEEADVVSVADEFAQVDAELSDLITQQAVALRLGDDESELTDRIATVRERWGELAQHMERYRFLDRQRNVLIEDLERVQTRLGEARSDNGTLTLVGEITDRRTVDNSRTLAQWAAVAAAATGALAALVALLVPGARLRLAGGDDDDVPGDDQIL